ncbi:MAG: polysaccharide deacetylase family protein [Bacteroidota bacterium]
MLLIYTHKISQRFVYTMRQVCTGILGMEISFTTKVEDFIKHKGPKITYTKKPLQNEFFVRSNDLLFEQGINDIDITIDDWEGIPCFFYAGERSNLPYDIFSASFYLLSRYEEYFPHVKDDLGRFPVKESLAYQNGFLKLPVVDIWAYQFMGLLKKRFPNIQQGNRKYNFTSIINVTTSHAYAHRGFARSIGGLFNDFGKFRIRSIVKRLSVWSGVQKDPYDNFLDLIEAHKRFPIKTMFFFQFAKYSVHDKNISTNNNRFRYLIKSVADYSIVSLSASYNANNDLALLKEEKKRLANLIHRPIKYSRLRYNRINIPETYRSLIEAEFTDDFTMGYTHTIGFRAGTCTPFYFYDINLEVQQPLKVHPFAIHDYAFLKLKKVEEVFAHIDSIFREVQKVDGSLTTIFSNELLGSRHQMNWMGLYTSLLKRYYA